MHVIREMWGATRLGALGRARAISLVALLCLLAGGCASRQARQSDEVVDLSGDATSSTTRVRVDNQNLKDMTIYAYQGSHRVRIGRVNGNSTSDLALPSSVVRNVVELRFFAQPFGGGRGFLSELIPVQPGDLVEFVVYSR